MPDRISPAAARWACGGAFPFPVFILILFILAGPGRSDTPVDTAPEAIKMSFDFRGEGIFQMALTADSVGVLPPDPGAGGLEPNDESDGIEGAVARRALTSSERDSAAQLLRLTRAFSGDRIFACDRDDGYGFSVWSDSLALHCRSCFSCAEGMGMAEAKRLARLGKLGLWVYRMRFGFASLRPAGADRSE